MKNYWKLEIYLNKKLKIYFYWEDNKKSENLKRDPNTGKLVFSVNDGEVQQRSTAEQMKIEADLIAEFETGTTNVEPVKKKKKKGKKGNGKNKRIDQQWQSGNCWKWFVTAT